MNRYCLLIMIFFGLISSCSDSELITSGDEFQIPGVPSGTFTAELNGNLYNFSKIALVESNVSVTQISGTSTDGQTATIIFPATLAVGTYTHVSGANITFMLGDELGVFSNLDTSGQLLPFTVKITDLDMVDMVVSGTFSGEVFNIESEETLTITNGKFFEIPFTIQDGGDGILRGNFSNGMEAIPLDFSINAQATGAVANAVISGTNDNYQNLKIIVPDGLEVGTFTETDEIRFEVTLGTSDNPNEFYTNYDEETETYLPVTLVITEIIQEMDGRVTGTFTGTIKKFTDGTDEEIEITEGIIDVPIVVATP